MKYLFFFLAVAIFISCNRGPACPAYNSVSYEGKASALNPNNNIEHKLSHLYEKRARMYREFARQNEIDPREKEKLAMMDQKIVKTRERLENKNTEEKKDAALNGRIKRGRTSIAPKGLTPR